MLNPGMSPIRDLYTVQQFAALMKTLAANGFSTVCYVDPSGNDKTAVRGNEARKFKTINAALLAAKSNDCVLIAPGFYQETVVVPPTIDRITIAALSPGTVVISEVGADVDTIRFTPTASSGGITLFNLYIFNSSTTHHGVRLDGQAIPDAGTFVSAINNCIIIANASRAIFLRRWNLIAITSTVAVNGLEVYNVSQVLASNLFCPGGLPSILEYDPTKPQPQGRGTSQFADTGFFGIKLIGAPSVELGIDCTNLGGIDGTLLRSFANAPGFSPQIVCHHQEDGNIDLPLPDADYTAGVAAANPMALNFDEARVSGNLAIVGAPPGGSPRVAATAKLAKLSGNVNVGSNIDLYMRGAVFNQSNLTGIGDGAIDRDTHSMDIVIPPAPTTFGIPIIPPFPSTVGSAYFAPVAAEYAGADVYTDTRAANSFVVQNAAGPGGNASIQLQRYAT